jgi:hypothetical protein
MRFSHVKISDIHEHLHIVIGMDGEPVHVPRTGSHDPFTLWGVTAPMAGILEVVLVFHPLDAATAKRVSRIQRDQPAIITAYNEYRNGGNLC